LHLCFIGIIFFTFYRRLGREVLKMGIKLVIVGAAGRMGGRIISLAVESDRFEVIAAVEKQGHPGIGKDAGGASGGIGILITDTYPEVAADVVVDFSQPEVINKTLDYSLDSGTALVSGITGLGEEQKGKIKAASDKIPVLYATNMSLGMNVLFFLAGKVASMLGPEYDIEIVEQHHRFKKDAPSGTALTLAENICKATERDFPESVIHGRYGKDAVRQKGTVGVHAVRAGDITGVHSVIFGTLGETVTLNHTANSRDTFARGALMAAQWLAGKEPGLYSMADVLGISA
jgi:4-hydroxy-tetrahydrodipicolinate reductase